MSLTKAHSYFLIPSHMASFGKLSSQTFGSDRHPHCYFNHTSFDPLVCKFTRLPLRLSIFLSHIEWRHWKFYIAGRGNKEYNYETQVGENQSLMGTNQILLMLHFLSLYLLQIQDSNTSSVATTRTCLRELTK